MGEIEGRTPANRALERNSKQLVQKLLVVRSTLSFECSSASFRRKSQEVPNDMALE